MAIDGEGNRGDAVKEWTEGRNGLTLASFVSPKMLVGFSGAALTLLWLMGVF